jgi:hypothetical protein
MVRNKASTTIDFTSKSSIKTICINYAVCSCFHFDFYEWVLIPTMKEINYSDKTRDLFNNIPKTLNTPLRSSLQLLQATQKKFRRLTSNQVSAAAMTSVSEEKWQLFNCFFSPENRDLGNHFAESFRMSKSS